MHKNRIHLVSRLQASGFRLQASGSILKHAACSLRPAAICFVLFLCIFCGIAFSQDKIIAIVNSEVITRKDLDDFTNFMRMQLSRDYSQEELEKQIQTLKEDFLEKLIEDKLILQEAKKNDYKIELKPGLSISIKPDEAKVRAKIDETRKRYSSDREFQEVLARQGLVQADLEQKVREQLLMYSVVEYTVRNKIVVRPDEVTAYYNKNIKEFLVSEEREVECFALEDRGLAQNLSLDLKEGKKLEDLAVKYPFTVNRIKAEKKGELKKDIEEAVFQLSIDEVSPPVLVDNKYYVFKLIGITPPRQLTLSAVQDKIYSFLFDSKMREKLNQWLAQLRDKSYIEIMQQ